jgi:hypothetical protein
MADEAIQSDYRVGIVRKTLNPRKNELRIALAAVLPYNETKEVRKMSPMKETAIKLIQEIPDDKIAYVLHVIRGINGLHKTPSATDGDRMKAYSNLQKFRGAIPADLDYAEELAGSRAERYESSN